MIKNKPNELERKIKSLNIKEDLDDKLTANVTLVKD